MASPRHREMVEPPPAAATRRLRRRTPPANAAASTRAAAGFGLRGAVLPHCCMVSTGIAAALLRAAHCSVLTPVHGEIVKSILQGTV